jgi:multicomponent Na+:H+ antiporter subunit E
MDHPSINPASFTLVFLRRFFWFGVAWWALSEGRWRDWELLLLSITSAVLVSLAFFPAARWTWRPAPLLAFIPFFLGQAILGGIDVAQRALRPALPLHPGFIELPLRLPLGPAAVFFIWTISLLPGSASVQLTGTTLRVHALDLTMPLEQKLRKLEERIAGLFGENLNPKPS